MNRIIFLGSGGGGHMVATQERKTGGLYFEFGAGADVFNFCVDPGPGALVHAVSLGLRPDKWKGLVLSHNHIDHVNDANAIIDSICGNRESKDKGFPFLVAEEHCLKMEKLKDGDYPAVKNYFQSLVKKLFPMEPGESAKIGDLELLATKAMHYATNVGYVLKYNGMKVGYPADGSYYVGQGKHFEGCDVLILNVPWPKGHDAPKNIHMTVDDAILLLKALQSKPKLVVLSHLGPAMLRSNLFKQEKILADATKCKVISANDFMELDLDTLKTRTLQPVAKF